MNASLSFENSQNKKFPFEVYYYHAFLILNVDSWPAPQTEINFLSSPSAKQRRNPCSGPQPGWSWSPTYVPGFEYAP